MDSRRVLAILVALAAVMQVWGQAPPTQPAPQKTLAATMNVYVFPTKGQTAEVQSQDEASCYTWAVQNAGVYPFDLQKQSQ